MEPKKLNGEEVLHGKLKLAEAMGGPGTVRPNLQVVSFTNSTSSRQIKTLPLLRVRPHACSSRLA